MVLKDGKINADGNFTVKAQDFDIRIPSIVKNKVSEDVNIIVDFVLNEK